MCSCRATNSLRPQTGSVIAHINVVLQLIDTGPLGRIVNQDDNEGCFHYVRDLRKGKQLCLGRNGKPAENLCVRIRGQTNTHVVVISATDCLIRKRPFFFQKKSPILRIAASRFQKRNFFSSGICLEEYDQREFW